MGLGANLGVETIFLVRCESGAHDLLRSIPIRSAELDASKFASLTLQSRSVERCSAQDDIP